MSEIKVKLSKPIKVGETEVSEISLREPTLGDLIAGEVAGQGVAIGKVAATLAAMADISLKDFKALSARDFARIDKAATPLLADPDKDGTS